jgi:ATP-dependent Clp protease ATP-binding subunit ClpC
VFENFTEPARQVVVLAQDEARSLKHNYIGTEHILLGLLREGNGMGARVLATLAISADAVREQVEGIVGRGEEVTAGQIPFTPRAKKVLELSLREALALGHDYIGTEHVLLGIVREGEGVACRILLDLGVSAEAVREEVIRAFSGTGRRVELHESSAGRLRLPPRRTPLRATTYRPKVRALGGTTALLLGWLLFAAAFGIGVLIGWAIWG